MDICPTCHKFIRNKTPSLWQAGRVLADAEHSCLLSQTEGSPTVVADDMSNAAWRPSPEG